jgi:hypothetical protein
MKFQLADTTEPSPDKVSDREWALALLERVITRLRDECAAVGKEKTFEQLKPLLTTDKTAISYPQAAVALGISEDTARVTVHRLRKRYRQLLRDAIAQTLADPAQVDEEMRALFGAFSRRIYFRDALSVSSRPFAFRTGSPATGN